MKGVTDIVMKTVSIIMAAGRGSRMKAYEGNKTLLPLVPGDSIYEGKRPILIHILDSLPEGPKAIIVNHREKDVMDTTRDVGLSYCRQPVLNGTGGALLAAQSFLEQQDLDTVIITMGDVPFVSQDTYNQLIHNLGENSMIILGFLPEDKKQYGVLEIENEKVDRITEWKYWKDYPKEKRDGLNICNSGIYAVKRKDLLKYLGILAKRPQIVIKEIDGNQVEIEEFFITDLVEYMVADGLSIGYTVAENEYDTMGIDDPEALMKAQSIYAKQDDV